MAVGRQNARAHVKLDARGVDFNLGTKKKPSEMFVAWDSWRGRAEALGNIRQYTITWKRRRLGQLYDEFILSVEACGAGGCGTSGARDQEELRAEIWCRARGLRIGSCRGSERDCGVVFSGVLRA